MYQSDVLLNQNTQNSVKDKENISKKFILYLSTYANYVYLISKL